MKEVITILFVLVLGTEAFSQKISKRDIEWVADEEVNRTIGYLNKLRKDSLFLIEETGVVIPNELRDTTTLVIDSKLQKLAEKRVLEMIQNNRLSHRTKHIKKRAGIPECVSLNRKHYFESHVVQYIIDKGVPNLGHREALLIYPCTVIGFAGGMYKGRTFTCFLQK